MPFFHCISRFEVLHINIFKIQPPDLLFLVVFISFYISRYHFPQFFRTSFNITWKKNFVRNFTFLADSLHLPFPHPFNGQNPLYVTKVSCWCSLNQKGYFQTKINKVYIHNINNNQQYAYSACIQCIQ